MNRIDLEFESQSVAMGIERKLVKKVESSSVNYGGVSSAKILERRRRSISHFFRGRSNRENVVVIPH